MLSLVRVVLVVSLVLGATLGVVACKSTKGERCQIDDDCETGLLCTSLNFCDTMKDIMEDAAALPDARPDGQPLPDSGNGPDAAPDAAVPDAAPDAT